MAQRDSCSVVWVLNFTLSAFLGSNRGGTGGRTRGTQANLILMLIFVYYNFFLLATGLGRGGRGGVTWRLARFVY